MDEEEIKRKLEEECKRKLKFGDKNEKQISYARTLGITDPEQYTRKELSIEIDKAVMSGKK
jgi:hypothetical protein